MDSWIKNLVFALMAISVAFYGIHYAIFRDFSFIARYVIAQLGFTPISVILVTLILNKLIGRREKQERLKKLNMVIGVFFGEAGIELLRSFVFHDKNMPLMLERIKSPATWDESDYNIMLDYMNKGEFDVAADAENIGSFREIFMEKRKFLLNLLENPNLLEHESFTELLWAVFHIAEELDSRKDFEAMSADDFSHISNDFKRAYSLIVYQWVMYMEHLKTEYPYLYSFALRENPYSKLSSKENVS